MSNDQQKGRRTYLVDCLDQGQEEMLLRDLSRLGIPHRWVAMDPNPEYDGEHLVGDISSYWQLIESVSQLLAEDPGHTDWPDLDPDLWPEEDRRTLVHLAATRWNYLGANGCEGPDVTRDYHLGLLPHTGNPVNLEKLDPELLEQLRAAAQAHLRPGMENTDENHRLMRRDVKAALREWNSRSHSADQGTNYAVAVARAVVATMSDRSA